MRFPKDTRAAIRAAAPSPVTISWPKGERQPEEGKVYRLQRSSEEVASDQARERDRRRREPETHGEVMAEMHRRWYGDYPDGYEPPAVDLSALGDLRIKVLSAEILDEGWRATVVQWESPDPANYLGVKAKVPAGPDPVSGEYQKVETEPERISVQDEDALTREVREMESQPVGAAIAVIEEQLDLISQDPAGIRVKGEVTFLQTRLQRLKQKAGRPTTEATSG